LKSVHLLCVCVHLMSILSHVRAYRMPHNSHHNNVDRTTATTTTTAATATIAVIERIVVTTQSSNC